MSIYKAPGVYVQDLISGSQSIAQASSSVGILIGVTRSGVIGVAQKVKSWTEFISKYANGLDTPFLENSYLPYAVHGFFANGGKELYIGSIKKEDAKKATKTGDKSSITVTASTEGTWGNNIKVTIKKSSEHVAEVNESYDVVVAVGTSDSVVIPEVYPDNIAETVMSNNTIKMWLSEFSMGESVALVEDEFTLSGGTDGSDLENADYEKALSMIDVLTDVTMVAIPGQTSSALNKVIMDYCDEHRLFPIIDMPMGSTAEETKAYRKGVNAFTGALCHPWGKMNDPLTNTLKTVPTAGHVMGVYARVIENRGIHKAPAGVDAVVKGFVEMEYQLTPTHIGSLNPTGVICITARPNAGIVLWGARSLNSTDPTMRYVSDGLLNLTIKKSLYEGTQFAVFEPNDAQLRSKVQAICKAFLETLRTSGALKGTADEAYYVTVDESNNIESTIAEGELHIEVGYAPVRPAEYVVIKLAHSIVAE